MCHDYSVITRAIWLQQLSHGDQLMHRTMDPSLIDLDLIHGHFWTHFKIYSRGHMCRICAILYQNILVQCTHFIFEKMWWITGLLFTVYLPHRRDCNKIMHQLIIHVWLTACRCSYRFCYCHTRISPAGIQVGKKIFECKCRSIQILIFFFFNEIIIFLLNERCRLSFKIIGQLYRSDSKVNY